MKVNFPKILRFYDYHEIGYFAEQLEDIVPGLEVEEIGLLDKFYMAIVYKTKDATYRRMLNNVQSEIEAQDD